MGSILEPTFVLPASAIAVAALVVTVTQGTFTQGVVPQTTSAQTTGPQTTGPQGRRYSSTSPIGVNAAGRGERSRVRASRGGAQTMEAALPSFMPVYVTGSSGLTGSSGHTGLSADGRGLALAPPSDLAVADSMRAAPRTIRLRVDGSGVARLSMSRRSPSRRSAGSLSTAGGPVFTSPVPDEWAAEFSRVMYGNPGSLAGGALVAAGHSAQASDGLVQSVARSRAISQNRILADLESEGADPRDAWLALGFEDPAEFARYIASQSLAEQELWAARLSERAEERGLLVEFLQALRDSGDVTAAWVAGDFLAQASARSDRESSGGDELLPVR